MDYIALAEALRDITVCPDDVDLDKGGYLARDELIPILERLVFDGNYNPAEFDRYLF